jgi:hypothetical protein
MSDVTSITLPEHICKKIEQFVELAKLDTDTKRKRTRFSIAATEAVFRSEGHEDVKCETVFIASALVTLDEGVEEKIRHYQKQAADAKKAAEDDERNRKNAALAEWTRKFQAANKAGDTKLIAQLTKELVK